MARRFADDTTNGTAPDDPQVRQALVEKLAAAGVTVATDSTLSLAVLQQIAALLEQDEAASQQQQTAAMNDLAAASRNPQLAAEALKFSDGGRPMSVRKLAILKATPTGRAVLAQMRKR